jgi:hypothetical protein
MWKDIEGYEGLYQISDKGEVKSLERYVDGRWGQTLIKEKILSPITAGKKYKMVGLSNNSNTKFVNIHRLLAQTFINNPHNKEQVNHIDGNKMNNELCNLEWVTCKENIIHSFKVLGRKSSGGAPIGNINSKNNKRNKLGQYVKMD